MKSFTIKEINEILKGELVGDTSHSIESPEQLDKAQAHQITFIGSKKYKQFWATSKASAAIVNQDIDLEPGENKAFIRVKNADLAMAKLLEVFNPPAPTLEEAIHPTATIHSTATLGKNCTIGANCYIGKNVRIGEGAILYPNTTIFEDTTIGNNTIIWSGTVVRERTIIGADCIIHSNVSIGADGFGYRPSDDGRGLVKIPQIGNVIIGDAVEIGANTCIDKAKFSSTIIGNGCKIDNLVQIGHNCVLGLFCVIAGHSSLAGSVTLGNGVLVGGDVSIKDHITIGDGATIGGGSGVITDVPAGKTVLGYPATDSREKLKQWVALRKLAKG